MHSYVPQCSLVCEGGEHVRFSRSLMAAESWRNRSPTGVQCVQAPRCTYVVCLISICFHPAQTMGSLGGVVPKCLGLRSSVITRGPVLRRLLTPKTLNLRLLFVPGADTDKKVVSHVPVYSPFGFLLRPQKKRCASNNAFSPLEADGALISVSVPQLLACVSRRSRRTRRNPHPHRAASAVETQPSPRAQIGRAKSCPAQGVLKMRYT